MKYLKKIKKILLVIFVKKFVHLIEIENKTQITNENMNFYVNLRYLIMLSLLFNNNRKYKVILLYQKRRRWFKNHRIKDNRLMRGRRIMISEY